MSKRRWAIAVTIVMAAFAIGLWLHRARPAERQIRQRLNDLIAEFNTATTDGIGTAARASRIGEYFESDIVIELGKGSPPIRGRDTLIGMAARLQPRTAAFVASLSDVSVDLVEPSRAEVTFTLMIRRRGFGSNESSLDAREFTAEMRSTDGAWRIAHVTAIDTFR